MILDGGESGKLTQELSPYRSNLKDISAKRQIWDNSS